MIEQLRFRESLATYRFSSSKMQFLLVLLFSLCFLSSTFGQYDIPEKPTKTSQQTAFYDFGVNLLSPTQQQSLEQRLIKYADTTSTQIVIVVIPSTNGEDIAMLGAKWLAKWGIGDAQKDNGILITVAKNDRQVDINTGYGIEYLLSDRDAERLINRIIVPNFKAGQFYNGLDESTTAMMQMLSGNYEGTREKNTPDFPIEPLVMFVIFIVIVVILSRNNHRGGGRGGKRSVAGSLLDVIILSNMGRGGFGGGSSWGGSSGGGFGGGGFGGGFGGGMGGGGGASGGW